MEQEQYNNLPDSQKWSAAKRDMIVGALWCIGGLAVTFFSYYFAKNGSKYVLAYGAILFGAFQGIRGLVNYLKLSKRYDEPEKFRKGLILGILSIALVAGLSVWGYTMSHKGNVKLLSYEQVIPDPVAGVEFTIPPKFGELEAEIVPESDSSCLTAYYYTAGTNTGISVTAQKDVFLYLAWEYILSDSTKYDQNDTMEINLAIDDINSYADYFDLLDSENLIERYYDSYSIVLGDRTYYKSSGLIDDGVSAIIYRTKNDGSMVEIRVVYESDKPGTNREMENWADNYVKSNFVYSTPEPNETKTVKL